jgi:methionyl-tRNA formyltransferase
LNHLRLIFMGSPDFAVPALDALIASGHDIVCVYCQPPRPAGRGHRQTSCPVHVAAEARGVAVRTPFSLKSADEQAAFRALNADVAVVAAYGLILPKAALAAPRLGCVNVHASLLPRWRGASPIQRAILAGDRQSGVTIMQMDEGLDTGPMLMAAAVVITAETTAQSLHDALATVGAELTVKALDGLANGTLAPTPQPTAGVTIAPKLKRGEGRLDWRRDASELERTLRALNPWPGTWFEHEGQRVRVLSGAVVDGVLGVTPGTILDGRLTVSCGQGALRLTCLQRAGKAVTQADSFLRGYPLVRGVVLT